MNCQECVERKEKPRRAEWMLWDEVLGRLLPLCQQHWQEYRNMEGELNLAFYAISDVDSWVRKANEELASWQRRHDALLKEGITVPPEKKGILELHGSTSAIPVVDVLCKCSYVNLNITRDSSSVFAPRLV